MGQLGGPPCPPILVDTVADPTTAQDQSFFFDKTGHFFAGGWVGFEYRISLFSLFRLLLTPTSASSAAA
jgi:hypothetical protein